MSWTEELYREVLKATPKIQLAGVDAGKIQDFEALTNLSLPLKYKEFLLSMGESDHRLLARTREPLNNP
ncbi:hypothetical protein [Hahella sp. NBU794]|uniref:hypothetical protein n=1 Tax=Hahella sp. NBU794 TaxID=3422590 RepID=UPI003D6E4BA1